jgi:hypothetical protein
MRVYGPDSADFLHIQQNREQNVVQAQKLNAHRFHFQVKRWIYAKCTKEKERNT